jgi:hypothetical protein
MCTPGIPDHFLRPVTTTEKRNWRGPAVERETTWKDEMTAARTIMLQVIPPFIFSSRLTGKTWQLFSM